MAVQTVESMLEGVPLNGDHAIVASVHASCLKLISVADGCGSGVQSSIEPHRDSLFTPVWWKIVVDSQFEEGAESLAHSFARLFQEAHRIADEELAQQCAQKLVWVMQHTEESLIGIHTAR